MRKKIILCAALALFSTPALAEENHDAHGAHSPHAGHASPAAEGDDAAAPDHMKMHQVEVIPNTQKEYKDKLLAVFRDKKADLTKKNGYFLDQAGNRVRLADLKGKIVLLDFIYSDCKHGICQYLNRKMNFIGSKFKERLGKDLVLVSLSFDDKDTPQTLAAFAANWENDPKKWAYLSGLPGDISAACKDYGIAFRWNEKEGFFEHTVRTILIGRDGTALKAYRGHDYKMQEAVDDIAALLAGKTVAPSMEK